MRRHAAALLLLGLSACAGEPPNPLLGDWIVALPTMPRAHGNEIGFRAECVIVRGDRIHTRIARPVRYAGDNGTWRVWFGPDAESLRPAAAAEISFLSHDRIEVAWPAGITARYLRTLAGADAERHRGDCGASNG